MQTLIIELDRCLRIIVDCKDLVSIARLKENLGSILIRKRRIKITQSFKRLCETSFIAFNKLRLSNFKLNSLNIVLR